MNRSIMQLLVIVMLVAVAAATGCDYDHEDDDLEKKVIATEDAPAAIGPYNQGILVGNTLYCAGQIALDPKTGELVTGTIEQEAHRVLKNLGAVLHAAGMDYEDAVRATVYLSDLNNYGAVNAVYAEYFMGSAPARVAVEVARLPKDVNVEISIIAVKVDDE